MRPPKYLDIKVVPDLSMSRFLTGTIGGMAAKHNEEPDEVDDLVAAWQRERADLDLGPVEVFSRIGRLARQLDLARREAFAEHDLESWEFYVRTAPRRAGEPYRLTPGRLFRETLVTSGTMTNRVDRLVGRGL